MLFGWVEFFSSKINISIKSALVATIEKFTPSFVIELPRGVGWPILIPDNLKLDNRWQWIKRFLIQYIDHNSLN